MQITATLQGQLVLDIIVSPCRFASKEYAQNIIVLLVPAPFSANQKRNESSCAG